jgi:cation transport regulator
LAQAEGRSLPHASIDDPSPSVRGHLPPHAQEIYLGTFNSAWAQYQARGPQQREEISHRVA